MRAWAPVTLSTEPGYVLLVRRVLFGMFSLHFGRSAPRHRPCGVAVGETVILLQPPLPLVGVSMAMERERQQNDSLANG